MATYRELLEMDFSNELWLRYYSGLGDFKRLISLKNEFINKYGLQEAVDFQNNIYKEIAEKQRKEDYEQASRYGKTIRHSGKVCHRKKCAERLRTKQGKDTMHRQIWKKICQFNHNSSHKIRKKTQNTASRTS